jgi:hypothetical protein
MIATAFLYIEMSARFKWDNTDFIAILSIVHISNFAYMEKPQAFQFQHRSGKKIPCHETTKTKRKKEWAPKILFMTSCFGYPQHGPSPPKKMSTDISTCFALCTVSSCKQETH